jgi:hypothetical protein
MRLLLRPHQWASDTTCLRIVPCGLITSSKHSLPISKNLPSQIWLRKWRCYWS